MNTGITVGSRGRMTASRAGETPVLTCPFCVGEEDLAFITEGLREMGDFYHDVVDLLEALIALAELPGLPADVRAVVERARGLSGAYRALQGVAV